MCKYEEIEGWQLSNGKTIREIKREKPYLYFSSIAEYKVSSISSDTFFLFFKVISTISGESE